MLDVVRTVAPAWAPPGVVEADKPLIDDMADDVVRVRSPLASAEAALVVIGVAGCDTSVAVILTLADEVVAVALLVVGV